MTSLAVADEDTVSVKACVGRLIALTTEEMTKQSEVIHNIQQPCSAIIVSMGGW